MSIVFTEDRGAARHVAPDRLGRAARRIERARFARPVPLAEGFGAIEAYLGGIGRPTTAFCACELRSPAQFTDAGFVAFNRHYVERLAAWGIFHDEINPVARSNVCPEIDPPDTPSFYAFCYTVPDADRTARSFVAAGSGEAREGGPSYEGRIIRRGDQSPEALREKARFVLGAFRVDAARAGAAAEVAPLVDELCRLSPEFKTMWSDNEVRGQQGEAVKHIRHPKLGSLAFEYSAFAVDGRTDLTMVVYNPATPKDAEAIKSLLS